MNVSIVNISTKIDLKEPVISTKELIVEYCGAIDHRIIYLLCLIFALWLLEPSFKRWAESLRFDNELTRSLIGGKNLSSIYKMIGLGLLFLAIYLLIIKGW